VKLNDVLTDDELIMLRKQVLESGTCLTLAIFGSAPQSTIVLFGRRVSYSDRGRKAVLGDSHHQNEEVLGVLQAVRPGLVLFTPCLGEGFERTHVGPVVRRERQWSLLSLFADESWALGTRLDIRFADNRGYDAQIAQAGFPGVLHWESGRGDEYARYGVPPYRWKEMYDWLNHWLPAAQEESPS